MDGQNYNPQEAADLLAIWEAAEDEHQASANYDNVIQSFTELSGGWEVHIYHSTVDDNVFLRFHSPITYNDHFIYIYTNDDPLYHILRPDTAHRIYSHELPKPNFPDNR
jgi:hypothetical protein